MLGPLVGPSTQVMGAWATTCGYNDGTAGLEAAIPTLDVHELLQPDVGSKACLQAPRPSAQPSPLWHQCREHIWCCKMADQVRKPTCVGTIKNHAFLIRLDHVAASTIVSQTASEQLEYHRQSKS